MVLWRYVRPFVLFLICAANKRVFTLGQNQYLSDNDIVRFGYDKLITAMNDLNNTTTSAADGKCTYNGFVYTSSTLIRIM